MIGNYLDELLGPTYYRCPWVGPTFNFFAISPLVEISWVKIKHITKWNPMQNSGQGRVQIKTLFCKKSQILYDEVLYLKCFLFGHKRSSCDKAMIWWTAEQWSWSKYIKIQYFDIMQFHGTYWSLQISTVTGVEFQ